jgi:hypothetical protein
VPAARQSRFRGWLDGHRSAHGRRFRRIPPPPFKPDDALQQLKRSLRDLKLAERGNGFELRGKRVLELAVEGAPSRRAGARLMR